jgi:hypothetical protein
MQAIQSSRRCAGVAQANTQLEAAIAETKTWARSPLAKGTVEPAKSMNSFSPASR